jgi:hypothetical protein
MTSNNETDVISSLEQDELLELVEDGDENQDSSNLPQILSNRVLRAQEVSADLLRPVGHGVSTEVHAQVCMDAHEAAVNIIGQSAWVTEMLAQNATVLAQNATVLAQNATRLARMESMESTRQAARQAARQTRQAAMLTRQAAMRNRYATMQVAMAAFNVTTVKSTIKAVGKNVRIRSINKNKVGQRTPNTYTFTMIVLEDGANVGEVPAAVASMGCLRSQTTVSSMTDDQINTFARAYGEQADTIPAEGVPNRERAHHVFEFLTA